MLFYLKTPIIVRADTGFQLSKKLMKKIKKNINNIIKWSEKYTGTDMLYIAKSGYWLNLNFIFTSILSFIFSIFLANFLSKETFGLYQFIISSFTIIGTFTLSGMNAVIIKNTALGFEGVLRKSITPQIKTNLIAFFISIFISIWYLKNNNLDLSVSFLIISVALPIISTFNSYNPFLIGKKLFKKYFIFNSILNLLYYGSMVLIIYIKSELIWLVLINYGVNSIVIYFLFKKTEKEVENKEYKKDFIEIAKHQSISNILPSILLTLDSILIYKILGPSSLAIYSIISILPTKLIAFLRTIITAASPKLAKHTEETIKISILSKTIKILMLGLIFGVFYIIIAEPIFKIFFPGYIENIKLSYLFVLPATLSLAASFSTTSFILTQGTRSIYLYNFIYPIISILLLIIGGLYFGLMGIIYARSLGYLITIILGTLMIRKIKNFYL